MPTKKNYKFDFFQCETLSSQRNNPPLTTGQILERIKRKFDSDDEDTVKNVTGRLLEIRSLDETDYGYKGSIGKYRQTDLPHAAVPGGDEREIELEDNEHLIEKTYFKYFNDYSLLILQRNRYAVSDQALSKYLSMNGYTTALNPVIEPDN